MKYIIVVAHPDDEVLGAGASIWKWAHNGEVAADESCFKEVARFRICPREKKYGIQIPQGTWHSIEVYESSTIFEAKDGAYGKWYGE